jgi:hypothetical protein
MKYPSLVLETLDGPFLATSFDRYNQRLWYNDCQRCSEIVARHILWLDLVSGVQIMHVEGRNQDLPLVTPFLFTCNPLVCLLVDGSKMYVGHPK